MTATAAEAPPGGSVVLHMQAPDADGSRVASFDPSTHAIRVFDGDGIKVAQIETAGLDGPAGLHWLASEGGLVWWDLDHVYVSDVPATSAPRVAYAIKQPEVEGPPLAIESVRVVPGGLLVVSQACGIGSVRRLATFVHLDDLSATDLTPWSGVRLHAATTLADGRVVLAVNETEHLAAAHVRCMLGKRGNAKRCPFMLRRARFGASMFRVLRIHRPGVVEVQSEQACPNQSCSVQGWAVGLDTFAVDTGRQLLTLRSNLDPGPLMPRTGGAWTRWEADRTASGHTPSHSLWLREGTVLRGTSDGITLRDVHSGKTRRWTGEARVRSARFTPEGDAIVVALEDAVVLVDVATLETRPLFDLLDVPAVFDARFNVRFNDASRLPNGTLVFDVAALHRPRGSLSTKTLRVGGSRQGCEGEEVPQRRRRDTGGISVATLRRLSPWLPVQEERRSGS